MNQGRFSDALELLEHPNLAGRDQRPCLLGELGFLGVPGVEDSALDTFAGAAPQGNPALAALCTAIVAAERGMRPEFDEARDRFVIEGSDLPGVDTVEVLALPDAYWAWKQEGRPDRARHLLETRAGPFQAHYWTFWLGEIRREMGDLEAAEEAYLTSLHPLSEYHYSLAWYRLARIYDELGDATKAREAWERVLSAWENGEPEVQPQVEEARRRLEALG